MEQINAIIIMEILGRPPEYVKEALTNLVSKLENEKIEVVSKKIAEPKEVGNNLFSCFTEVEFKSDFMTFLGIIFRYMPSHIDIIKPEHLGLKNSDINLIFNEIVKRLHQYDEIAKAVLMERDILKKQLIKIQEGRSPKKPGAKKKAKKKPKNTKKKQTKKKKK